jgi:flagellar M-ring protein FliF
LLSGTQGDDALAGSSRQREYTREIEADYQHRIENLLAPLVGAGKVRAGVTAEIDFTQQEVTREDFDPTQQVVRSEQTSLDQRTAGAGGAEGVPGSLSNQPPGTVPLTGPGSPGAPAAGTPGAANAANAATAANATATAGAAGAAANNAPSNVAQRSTRNFEIDRTISHVRNPVGNVRRLSVAVVIDNRVVKGADGKPVSQAVSAAELERYTALVRDVVGFDEQRGDRVQVLNETFQPAEPAGAAVPSEPLWSQPATQGYIRQGVAVLLVLLVVAFVLRPVMKGLFPAPGTVAANAAGSTVLLAHRAAPGEVLLEPAAGRPGLPAPGAPIAALPSPQHFDQQVANARARVGQDPRRAAQVVKEWVAADG